MSAMANLTNATGVATTLLDDPYHYLWPPYARIFVDGFRFSYLRRFRYLVLPSETKYATMNDVPDILNECRSWIIFLILFEAFMTRLMGKDHIYRFNDASTGYLAGQFTSFYRLAECIVNRYICIYLYTYIYENFRLVTLDWDQAWLWYFAFILEDLVGYWWHRALHELGVLWAFHHVHHSGQYFNFTVAMRQAVPQDIVATLFESCQALIIPPQVYLLHFYLNILNQFWLHMHEELYPKGLLGPLEYVLNTPSHHRVHHGRNPYCIDKNYGAVFIIWDRIFGTFAEERLDEKPVFGVTKTVNSFDQLWLQFHFFKYAFYDKPWKEIPAAGGTLKDSLLAYVYPVSWVPGKKLTWAFWWRKKDTEEDVPAIENPVQIYDPVIPTWLYYYAWVQLIFQSNVYSHFIASWKSYSSVHMGAMLLHQVAAFQAHSYIVEAKPWVPKMEMIRMAASAAYLILAGIDTPIVTPMLLLGAVGWFVFLCVNGCNYQIRLVQRPAVVAKKVD